MGGRGLTSLEASLLKDAKDRYKRAKAISMKMLKTVTTVTRPFATGRMRMTGDWPIASVTHGLCELAKTHLVRGSRSQLASLPMPSTNISCKAHQPVSACWIPRLSCCEQVNVDEGVGLHVWEACVH